MRETSLRKEKGQERESKREEEKERGEESRDFRHAEFKVDLSAAVAPSSCSSRTRESIHHNQLRRQLNGACGSFITIVHGDSRYHMRTRTQPQLNFSLRRKLARKAARRWSSRSCAKLLALLSSIITTGSANPRHRVASFSLVHAVRSPRETTR